MKKHFADRGFTNEDSVRLDILERELDELVPAITDGDLRAMEAAQKVIAEFDSLDW